MIQQGLGLQPVEFDLYGALRNPLTGASPSSKMVAGTLASTALLSNLIDLHYAFALVPINDIPPSFWIWNLVTASFCESSLVHASYGVLCILVYGRFMEAMWGQREFLRFLLIVAVVSSTATFVSCIGLYLMTGHFDLIMGRFYGSGGIVCALTVALKQMCPEQSVLNGSPFYAHQLPWVALTVEFTFAMLTGNWAHVPLTVFGLAGGWVYLRFYQVVPGVDDVGDPSDSFSLASFCPLALQPGIKVISTVVFALLVACRVCRPMTSSMDSTGSLRAVSSEVFLPTPLPNSDPAEAERRRARALRALEGRLASMQSPKSPLPTQRTPTGSDGFP